MILIRNIIIGIAFSLCMVFCLRQPCKLSDADIGKDVSEILSLIPKSDKKSLEYFFHDLLQFQDHAYVLFGKKPMSLDVVIEDTGPLKSFRDIWFWIIPVRRRVVRGYKTWRKYEKFFPLKQFLIFYEAFSQPDQLSKNTMLVLVNRENFQNCVAKYSDDFEHILGKRATAYQLLEEGKERPFITEVLQNHDAIIGTLLGYGRDNGFLFHQLAQLPIEQWDAFCNENHFHSAWTDEEFAAFNKQFKSVSWINFFITGSYLEDFELMALPGFRAIWGSEETEYWRKEYLDTKQTVIEYYKGKNFLEATLRVLTQ